MPSTKSKHHSSTSHSTPTATPQPSTGTTSAGLGKSTIIIIAVLASVGGIVFILVVYRYVRRRLIRRGSVPLPPVQPIAHHREQQLAQFEDRRFLSSSPANTPSPLGNGSSRNSSWAQQQQQYLMAPANQAPIASGSTSDASLIQNKELENINTRSASPSPNLSLLNQKDMMAALDNEKPLPHPTPAFHGTGSLRDNSSSIGSMAELASSSSMPFPETPSSFSAYTPTQFMRPRPLSMTSTASRTSRKSTAGTIRGAPHGPHSNVQIVLPAPLAPQLSPYGHVARGGDGGWLLGDGVRTRADSRLSVVDKWAGVPVGRSEREERESFAGLVAAAHADGRDSMSTSRTSSSSHYSPFPSTSQPKSKSQSPLRSLPHHSPSSSPRNSRYGLNPPQPPSSFRDHSLTPPPQAPPVPRIPSVYNQFPGAVNLDDDPPGAEAMAAVGDGDAGERVGRPASLSLEHRS